MTFFKQKKSFRIVRLFPMDIYRHRRVFSLAVKDLGLARYLKRDPIDQRSRI
jgi:hypothetical protein